MSKSEARIELPTPEAVAHILDNVREGDIEEIMASHGVHPRYIVPLAVNHEETRVGIVNDEPICIFGASRMSLVAPGAAPWLLATDGLYGHRVAFLRRCRDWVREMHSKYGYLENYVYDRNTAAVQWLKWLGFDMDEPAPYGRKHKLFRRFFMGDA